jgi:hypothetical protein
VVEADELAHDRDERHVEEDRALPHNAQPQDHHEDEQLQGVLGRGKGSRRGQLERVCLRGWVRGRCRTAMVHVHVPRDAERGKGLRRLVVVVHCIPQHQRQLSGPLHPHIRRAGLLSSLRDTFKAG